MTSRDELMTAAGAYALGALGEPEKSEFEALMAESEQLRAEVTELMDTAVELGLSVAPVDPPPALRARILDAVATTPQLAPLAEERREATRLEASETPAEVKARARWRTPLARLGAVAAAVALIVGLGFTIRFEMRASTSYGSRVQSAVIASSDDTGRSTIGCP
jgi:anti-sigma-K factor RskA